MFAALTTTVKGDVPTTPEQKACAMALDSSLSIFGGSWNDSTPQQISTDRSIRSRRPSSGTS